MTIKYTIYTALYLLTLLSLPVAADDTQTVTLQAYKDGHLYNSKIKFTLNFNQTTQLAVKMITADGKMIDVTSNQKTKYFPITQGCLSISGGGAIGFTQPPSGCSVGIVYITFGDKGDKLVGITSVIFNLIK